MAGNFSNYLEEQLLNHVFRGTAYTSPTAYVGIVTDTATDTDLEAGDLTNEITDYTGERKTISFTTPVQDGGKATIESNTVVDFEDMPAVTVKYAVVTDSETITNSVIDESFTSNFDTAVDLANDNLINSSVTVTTTDGATTYTENTDYEINYVDGTITVLSGGSMSDSTAYHIDYSYHTGNILMWIPATNIRTTQAGDTYRVPLGDMIIDLD